MKKKSKKSLNYYILHFAIIDQFHSFENHSF